MKESVTGVSIPTEGENKGKLVIEKNKLTADTDIKLKLVQTPYEYAITYAITGDDDLTTKMNNKDATDVDRAKYPLKYTYAEDSFILFADPPAKDFKVGKWTSSKDANESLQ